MRLDEKKQVVEKWQDVVKDATVMVLANYSGITANQMNVLRGQFREAGITFHVVKNTLVRRAIKDTNFEGLSDMFKGTIALAVGTTDQIAPAKILVKATKDFPKLQIVGGALDGKPLDAEGVIMLSKMPGRNELRSQFLGLLTAVPGGFLRVLNAVPGGMVNVLDARRRQLEEKAA